MKVGLIGIDEYVDETQGIHYERYNLHGLYEKLASCLAEEHKDKSPEGTKFASPLLNARPATSKSAVSGILFLRRKSGICSPFSKRVWPPAVAHGAGNDLRLG